MLTFVTKYGSNRYSQNGEDGIIAECLKRIKPPLQVSVEFGAPDTTYCSNTAALVNWIRHYYDPAPQDEVIIKKFITPDNVNELPACSVLSIDIDGNDYNVWKAYTGKPDIVIIEINSSVEATAAAPISDLRHGTAYRPMVELGISKGYFLLCHTGNLIFVVDKHINLFPEVMGNPVIQHESYFNTSFL